jgi:molybdate transport system substrate-binding protein
MKLRPVPAVLALMTLTACGGSSSEGRAAPGGGDDGRLTGTLTVFAAASLANVFPGLGDRLTAHNQELEVQFNFAGSSGLAAQIVQGAPADVFASANEAQMTIVADAELQAQEAVVFTRNVLQIAVPAGNPAEVTGIEDFGREELTLAVCAPDVPCGAAADQIFAAAGVTAAPDTLEEDVRAALTKVELGEVDAALVYASDVTSAGDAVEGIEVPEAEDAVNRYPIAVLEDAPNAAAAEAFLVLMRSDAAQQALRDAGFRAP